MNVAILLLAAGMAIYAVQAQVTTPAPVVVATTTQTTAVPSSTTISSIPGVTTEAGLVECKGHKHGKHRKDKDRRRRRRQAPAAAPLPANTTASMLPVDAMNRTMLAPMPNLTITLDGSPINFTIDNGKTPIRIQLQAYST